MRRNSRLPSAKGINILSRFETGHRRSYIRFAEERLGAKRVTLKQGFFAKPTLVFLMIEEWFFLYFITALFRSLIGRKTMGLLFRPEPTIKGRSIRLRLKMLALQTLKKVNNVRTLTILPFFLRPEYEKISDDWIYDFQFWDVSEADVQIVDAASHGHAQTTMARDIVKWAQGRKIVVAIGGQSRMKGFDTFAALYSKHASLQKYYYFVAAGKIAPELQDAKKSLVDAGGYANDAFISETELRELYGISDLVWAYYNPSYDQASGIFGRALQFGKGVIVRSGSLIETFAQHHGHPVISLSDIDSVDAFMDIPQKSSINTNLQAEFSSHSLAVFPFEENRP